MQEGATIASVNGNPSYGFSAVYLQVVAEPSPYPTGYELNGLSNTGDWYQFLIEDNWPGCAAGFGYALEVWNNSGGSAEPTCFPSVGQYSISPGDAVTLGLNFSGSNVCMDWTDFTSGGKGILCVQQPNSGGYVFESMQQIANSEGYFTGPMTEVVEPGATSCAAYLSVPTQSYRFVQGAYISSFFAWSEERQLGGSPCYWHASAQISEAPGNYQGIFVEATGGSTYGPHWEEAANTSAAPSAFWWTFSTDRPPASVSVSRTSADVGQSVVISGASLVGAPPFSYRFVVDGTVVGTSGDSYIWAPEAAGSYSVSVQALNATGALVADSSNVTIQVSPDPVAPPVAAGPASGGIDNGQSVTFWMNATGGSGGLTISWDGLPGSCVESIGSVSCSSAPSGSYLVYAVVNDSNGMSVMSPTLLFVVNPLPSISLRASSSTAATGSSVTFFAIVAGGSAPYVFRWSGLPGSCTEVSSATFSMATCTPNSTGTFSVTASVSDGASASNATAVSFSVLASNSTGGGITLPWWAFVAVGAAVGVIIGWVATRAGRSRAEYVPPTDSSRHAGAGFAPGPITPEQAPSSERADEPAAPYWLAHPPPDPTCRRCGNVNPPGSLYCGKCAIPLDSGSTDRVPPT